MTEYGQQVSDNGAQMICQWHTSVAYSHVATAVAGGQLNVLFDNGSLKLVLDALSGIIRDNKVKTGWATFRGAPLTHLNFKRRSGIFKLTITQKDCELIVKDKDDWVLLVWIGVGSQEGLLGTYMGNWKAITD